MTPQELKNSILQLAIQGKLVEQRSEEGTAGELYQQIQNEKQRLIKEGKIKREKLLPDITEEEKPFDIPEGWKWARLSDLCSLISDGTHKTPAYVETGVPFLSVKDISSGIMDFSHTRFISIDEHKQLITRCKPEKNDILICRIGTLGKALQIDTDREFSIFVSLGLIKLLDPQISQYIVTAINSGYGYSWIQKVKVGGGTHTFKINLDDLRLFPIPLPPAKEQKRIHTKIEELLPLIDRYEKAYNQLVELNKRFPEDLQKSLLQMAIQGKLVEQRPEEGTGEELYRQIQAEKQKLIKDGKIKKEKPLQGITEEEKPFDIPENWKWVKLQDISNSILAGKSIRCNETVPEDGIPGIVKVSSVTWGAFDEYESKSCLGDDEWNEDYQIHQNDFLISRANTKKLVGACVVVESIRKKLMLSDKILRISFSSMLDKYYILYALRSHSLRVQIESMATGTSESMKNISQSNIRDLILPLPPLAEQKRIVAKLEELLPLCEKLKGQ